MVSRYVPDMGDLIWVDFDPTKGSEQAGHRPAVVLSPFMYNNEERNSCPRGITTH